MNYKIVPEDRTAKTFLPGTTQNGGGGIYLFFRLQITTKTNSIPTISIPVNTARTLLMSSWAGGILTLYLLREGDRRLIKESWNGSEVSK